MHSNPAEPSGRRAPVPERTAVGDQRALGLRDELRSRDSDEEANFVGSRKWQRGEGGVGAVGVRIEAREDGKDLARVGGGQVSSLEHVEMIRCARRLPGCT